MRRRSEKFVICIENDGYAASLEKRKVYIAIPDRTAHLHKLIRVIDESGDDYLYPESFFRPIDLPAAVKKAIRAA